MTLDLKRDDDHLSVTVLSENGKLAHALQQSQLHGSAALASDC